MCLFCPSKISNWTYAHITSYIYPALSSTIPKCFKTTCVIPHLLIFTEHLTDHSPIIHNWARKDRAPYTTFDPHSFHSAELVSIYHWCAQTATTKNKKERYATHLLWCFMAYRSFVRDRIYWALVVPNKIIVSRKHYI